jgi:hypothetical protein
MSSNNQGPPLVSSSTTTALMLTYRPIIFLLFAGPAMILSMTLIPVISQYVLDYVTSQHTLLAICMTIFFSKTIENLIIKAAPTKEKAIKSLEKSRCWLSYFMIFVTNVFIIRLIVIPLEEVLGLKHILTWSPSLSFSTAIRLACGGLLLGLSVGKLEEIPFTRRIHLLFIHETCLSFIHYLNQTSHKYCFFQWCISRPLHRTSVCW